MQFRHTVAKGDMICSSEAIQAQMLHYFSVTIVRHHTNEFSQESSQMCESIKSLNEFNICAWHSANWKS